MVPVRCYSCGRVLKENYSQMSVVELRKLLKRTCCVRMCLSAFDVLEEQLKFQTISKITLQNGGILQDPSEEMRSRFTDSNRE